MNPDHYAVVVGIRKYPGFQDLDGPCNDARAFRDWLVHPDKGGLDPANVYLQTTHDFHPPEPEGVKETHPFDAEIRNLFYDMVRDTTSRAWIGERLYIYMAGHGFTEPLAERNRLAGLYAANADTWEAGNVVGTMYAEWFRMWAGFREIVLIMDCCRVNDVLQQLNTSGLPRGRGRPGESRQVRTFYAYATQPGQVARERAMDGGEVRGIFTATLLEALDRAPPDEQGRVTGQVVKGYVHQNLRSVAGEVSVDDPEFDSDDSRDIVFLVRDSVETSTVRFRLDPFDGPVEIVVYRGPGEEVARVRATEPETSVELRPGYYKPMVDGVARPLFEVGGADVRVTL